jgi:hypothetical protein
MFCGLKNYSTGLSWLTVKEPNDPSTENFELQVNTIDYNLAGMHKVSLVVTFENSNYSSTITE